MLAGPRKCGLERKDRDAMSGAIGYEKRKARKDPNATEGAE